VAAIAERVSAVFDGARLFLCLVAHRRVRQHHHLLVMAAREKRDEKQARPPASSTAIGEDGGKRGAARFDAGKKIRAAATYRHRHARNLVVSSCMKPTFKIAMARRAFWRRSLALSMAASRLRRRRLRRRQAARRVERQGSWTLEITNVRIGRRASKFYRALGRRKNLCVARKVSPPRQGLRSSITSAVAWVLVAHIRTITRVSQDIDQK